MCLLIHFRLGELGDHRHVLVLTCSFLSLVEGDVIIGRRTFVAIAGIMDVRVVVIDDMSICAEVREHLRVGVCGSRGSVLIRLARQ